LKELLIIVSIILVVFAAGCTSAPVKETANATDSQNRYVKLLFTDGTEMGGKYVSESAAFVTINPMYIIMEDGSMARGNGNEVGIKTSMITSVVTIPNPSEMINATLKAQDDKAAALAAAQKLEEEKRQAEIQKDIEKRNAELEKRMPTKPKVYKST